MAKWRSFTRNLATAWRSIKSSSSSPEVTALPEGWKTVRLIIQGRVQGVSYRWWTVGAATQRGLNGWVRNRRDGSVEALVSGPIAQVDDLIEACRQGPSAARVMDIEIVAEEGAVTGGFEQRSTV
jgi:acylphosphatase